jgi:hypothetical protein
MRPSQVPDAGADMELSIEDELEAVALDDELRGLLDAGRERVLNDKFLREQARRVKMTPDELAELVNAPDKELWEPCQRGLADLRRVDREIAQYQEFVRSHLADVPPSPAPGDAGRREPSSAKKERRDKQARDAAGVAEQHVQQVLDHDTHWQVLLQRRQVVVERLEEVLVEQSLMPRVRLEINRRRREMTSHRDARRTRFRQPLLPVDSSGLRQRADEKTMVATGAADELSALTLPDPCTRVSVGVAGPRGSGKSTLLASTYDRWTSGVRIFVPAPTSYAPREFLLYLNDEQTLTRPVPPGRLAAVSLLSLVVVPLAGTVAGACLLISAATSAPEARDPLLHALGGALVALAAVPLAIYLIQRRAWPGNLPGTAASAGTYLLVFDLLRWRLPDVRRVLASVVVVGAALFVVSEGDRWGITFREAMGGALLIVAALTSVFWIFGERPVDTTGTPDEPLLLGMLARARRLLTVTALGAGQLVAVVVAVALLLPETLVTVDAALAVGTMLTAGSGTALAVGVRLRRLLQEEARSLDAPPLDACSQQAKVARERIRYQRTQQSGWTSTVKMAAPSWMPFGVDAGITGQTTEAEAPMSVPEIIDGIKALLPVRGPAVVAIDELDKVESVEKARDFLNEIKGVLEAPGTCFLVSMSEDAIASFERRGLPFRDVFDSAFDEVVPVPYLSPSEARAVLNRRITDVPPPFLALAYCQAGGLPRDLLRAIGRMIKSAESQAQSGGPAEGMPLAEIAREIVHRDLAGKTEAVSAAIRSLGVEPAVSDVLRAINRLDECAPPAPRRGACLLDDEWLAPVLALEPVLPRIEGERDDDLAERRTLLRLTVELVGYFYYCRTLLEFFDVGSEESVDRLIAAVDDPEGRALGKLVRARQNFAVNPFVAWGLVTDFRTRKEIRLQPFELPTPLKPPDSAGQPPTQLRPSAHQNLAVAAGPG